MPDVVVVEERQQDAVPVVLARFRWSFLTQQRNKESDAALSEKTSSASTLAVLNWWSLHEDAT